MSETKRYLLERRALPNGRWQEIGQYSTWRALQTAKRRDQRKPRGDPCEWNVTTLPAHSNDTAARGD